MNVGFRVDASSLVGSGHVMRCLSLANALKSSGAFTIFVCATIPEHLLVLLTGSGHRVQMLGVENAGSQSRDAYATLEILGDVDLVVVDHYGLGIEWESIIQPYAKIFALDDLGRDHVAKWVLDQNLYSIIGNRYKTKLSKNTVLLEGPKYALLRPEFRIARNKASIRQNGLTQILVFLGGMDNDNVTSLVLEALEISECDELVVNVVVGPTHPAMNFLKEWCASRPSAFLHVQTNSISDLMLRADLAIGAGGINTWERCSVGLPAIALTLAENQSEVIAEGTKAGIIHGMSSVPTACELANVIRFYKNNPMLIEAMSRRAYAMTDADGVSRIGSLLSPPQIKVRLARLADSKKIYEWRTSSNAVRFSKSQSSFGFEDHLTWFNAALADSQRLILVGEYDGIEVGVVRYDFDNFGKAIASIFLSNESQGKRLGSSLLNAAEDYMRLERPDIRYIEALVVGGNTASEITFRRSGYSHCYDVFKKVFE